MRGKTIRYVVGAAAIGLSSWTAYSGIAWFCYGRRRPAGLCASLNPWMNDYEVADRHAVVVSAPVDTTFSAATAFDIQQSAIIRAIFRSREWMLGASRAQPVHMALADWVQTMGWVRLAEVPGREVIFGAVTRPWEARVVFRSIPADSFACFRDPDYVKIVWNLRAELLGRSTSLVSTETRVATTSPAARTKFRRYWAVLSPGIVLIRLIALKMVKRAAERRALQLRR